MKRKTIAMIMLMLTALLVSCYDDAPYPLPGSSSVKIDNVSGMELYYTLRKASEPESDRVMRLGVWLTLDVGEGYVMTVSAVVGRKTVIRGGELVDVTAMSNEVSVSFSADVGTRTLTLTYSDPTGLGYDLSEAQ